MKLSENAQILIPITTIIILIGLLKMPYAYYTFVRIFACGTFSHLCYITYQQKKIFFVTIFAIFAILYNPIFRVFLKREIWFFINIFSCVQLGLVYFKYRNQ
jgi:hypothetical protein